MPISTRNWLRRTIQFFFRASAIVGLTGNAVHLPLVWQIGTSLASSDRESRNGQAHCLIDKASAKPLLGPFMTITEAPKPRTGSRFSIDSSPPTTISPPVLPDVKGSLEQMKTLSRSSGGGSPILAAVLPQISARSAPLSAQIRPGTAPPWTSTYSWFINAGVRFLVVHTMTSSPLAITSDALFQFLQSRPVSSA